MSEMSYRESFAAGAPSALDGSAILAERAAAVDVCACGESTYRGRCYNVGACRMAERSSVATSLQRGTAASTGPAAWTLGGRVD